jgi:hypothetical protein
MMLWPNRLIVWLRRKGIVAILALIAAGLMLWSALDSPGQQPSAVHMRPR